MITYLFIYKFVCLSIFNQLNVQIKTEAGAFWTDSVSADINSYVMNIRLKPVKN